MHMNRAYWKDIWRSVTKGKKRFISIALIATLGVTMMCGLRAACVDLRYSADAFFDEQNLFDIRVLSTMGLTDEDVGALKGPGSVKDADGGYSETVYTQVEGMRRSIEGRTLSEKKFNQPYLLEGKLPTQEDEIVITENFKNQSGKGVGDEIALDEEAEYLKSDTYTITGIIIDAMDINSSEGAMGFRSTATTDYVGYVVPEAADSEIYTVVYLSLKGVEELNCYTDEYEQEVERVVKKIESEIKDDREQARYDEVYGEVMSEWGSAVAAMGNIDMPKWYVQDRSSLSGYSNIKSDANSIQAIGDVFPVLFLTVAILISLTTITRMVEEERGLIGTYKALGFTNSEIRRKYIIYAATACLIGGLLGDIGGYIVLPSIIFIVFRVMYILPEYAFRFDVLYGFGGILLFEVGILAATAYACKKALKKTPAKLMRPKSPKAGSRVLLERIPFIWKRLSFLNKVTARNLFRYKKRLFMTVFGITGCMALLLCGFTIKNTITEMMPQQYQNIYQYDMMAVVSAGDFENLSYTLENDEEIEDYVSARIESIEIMNEEGQKESVQLMAVPEGGMLDSYICLRDEEKNEFELKDGEIFVTRNAAKILGVGEGDTVTLQNLDLVEVEAPITRIVENYLGNMIYMTEATYTELFETYEINGALVHFSDACEDQAEYTDELARQEGILSAMSTQAMEDEFEPAFALINMVVYVILVLAALLAFVVLFTLSNTNISERVRELATIKVLGFYYHEVHFYVNKETLILTAIGILCGMPAGLALGRYLMGILEFPSLEFYIILYPESYLYAGAITLIFALIVNVITNRTLDKINMVEALKSVE